MLESSVVHEVRGPDQRATAGWQLGQIPGEQVTSKGERSADQTRPRISCANVWESRCWQLSDFYLQTGEVYFRRERYKEAKNDNDGNEPLEAW